MSPYITDPRMHAERRKTVPFPSRLPRIRREAFNSGRRLAESC